MTLDITRRTLLRTGAVAGLVGTGAVLDLTTLTPAELALAAPGGAVDLDVLYVGAHPDDEAWTLAAFGQWNEFLGTKVGVITITRGEGGGNAVGLEEGPPLGLRRELEEREAVGYAGIEHVFNLDALDFFYTMSAPLSSDIWGGDAVLNRIVRVIRATRPQVIVTMNPSPVPGNHGNHQQAAMFAVEAYLRAGDGSFYPEHAREGFAPFAPLRIFRSGSTGTGGTGPGAVAAGYQPRVASDLVFGCWNGTMSEKWGERWSAVRDRSIRAYATQGWAVFPPTTTDPDRIPSTWFTLLGSRAPLADPKSSGDAALRGALLPITGGLDLGTHLEVEASSFSVIPGVPFDVKVTLSNFRRPIPGATFTLEVPSGWTTSGPVTVGALVTHRPRTVTIKVTPSSGAQTGTDHLIWASVSTRGRGSGRNSVPVRVTGKVEGSMGSRPEIANFHEWADHIDMKRLDLLVPTLQSLGSGRARPIPFVLTNHTGSSADAQLVIDLPAGFTATPSSVAVTGIPARGSKSVDVVITNTDSTLPTANRAPNGGTYEVGTTVSSGGTTVRSTQGINLVPVLRAIEASAAPVVDGVRSAGEYPDNPISIGTLWEGQAVTPEDASGYTWVTYDAEALHIFVDVRDDVFGAVLVPEDNKQRFRTDSVEILIDPRGQADNTSTTFILAAVPMLDDPANGDPPGFGRDHDGWQGPAEITAPGTRVAAHVREPYDGYTLEVMIPYADLPDAIDPENCGFNVVVYDSDTQDRTGQSRIGWSTYSGVQADPYRWGVLELPSLPARASAPVAPRFPDTAAKSVESPTAIIQAAGDGVPLGGYAPIAGQPLRVVTARRYGNRVDARFAVIARGTLRAYLWDGEKSVGSVEVPARPGMQNVAISLTGEPTGALTLAASLEQVGRTAAAAAPVR